ncbi:hypothetical protein BCR37DRAFT_392879 [Protomyces lactucae-debilis]|uniref:Erg28-like protein n=1 Tax=Protomyces lactucae-debilis TaxID=2754530 RepID=A0A1Y2FFF4_PROLT|nr:uncharacterized protein BCR37DRAFT_392879 [Protomyces lactucae-debilis]ORY82678.1 hypothetical protein BCR37DRAFT_392879 [Protomyces lactucae-debilis]
MSSFLNSDLLKGLTQDGLLPLWMTLVSGMALFNAVQNYLTTSLTKRVYSKTQQVNALQARTFGVWTITSALIRAYAAVNIHDPILYQLALYSYYIAAFHFGTEILIYRTAGWGAISPVIVSCEILSAL